MAKSTQVITDLKTAYSNGPSSVTKANAVAPAGPIEDWSGNINLCINDCYSLQRRLIYIIDNTDGTTDAANLALLQGVQQVLV